MEMFAPLLLDEEFMLCALRRRWQLLCADRDERVSKFSFPGDWETHFGFGGPPRQLATDGCWGFVCSAKWPEGMVLELLLNVEGE